MTEITNDWLNEAKALVRDVIVDAYDDSTLLRNKDGGWIDAPTPASLADQIVESLMIQGWRVAE